MQLSFLSNYYNHHQKPLCEALERRTAHQFAFIATEQFSDERRQMGWTEETAVPFVQHYDDMDASERTHWIGDSDAVLLGNAPRETVTQRLAEGKPVLFYAERIFKSGYQPLKWLPRLGRFWQRYGRHRPLYLLVASAYATADYNLHGAFLGKSYKWGYFPETKHYDIDTLMAQKQPARILWCGRFLGLKHPEQALAVAARLKTAGYAFELELIGSGELEETLRQQIAEGGLSDCVRMTGALSPEEVRTRMETAGIYLFTSDFHEGWGAVLNEAMNSGCAVVASHAIGAVPFLVKPGENGQIYRSGDTDALYRKVKFLLDHPETQQMLGRNAYDTIVRLWNAETAAERLLCLTEDLRRYGRCDRYEDGPCSRAPFLTNHWFKE